MSIDSYMTGNRFGVIAEPDLPDHELLGFALAFADRRHAAPAAATLLAAYGDVDLILASDPDELCDRAGLSPRAVAVLKLLHAFRSDNRRGRLLH